MTIRSPAFSTKKASPLIASGTPNRIARQAVSQSNRPRTDGRVKAIPIAIAVNWQITPPHAYVVASLWTSSSRAMPTI